MSCHVRVEIAGKWFVCFLAGNSADEVNEDSGGSCLWCFIPGMEP